MKIIRFKTKEQFKYKRKVIIKNLILNIFIGIHDFEKKKKQRVRFNIDVETNSNIKPSKKDFSTIINYETLVDKIKTLVKRQHHELLEELAENIGGTGIVHHTQPSVVSITQLCETGEVYQLDEIAALSETAHKHNLKMHMDGARFANALVSLDATPAEMTWKSGIDVLSFGATKNGCIAAEAIIFFKPELVGNLPFLMKRSGHLLSKMRFVSAQLEAYISNDIWLRNAKHANLMGKKLSEGLDANQNIELAYPTEANEVFAKFPKPIIEHLNSEGYKMNQEELDGKAVRLVAAWNTKESDVDQLLETISQINQRHFRMLNKLHSIT